MHGAGREVVKPERNDSVNNRRDGPQFVDLAVVPGDSRDKETSRRDREAYCEGKGRRIGERLREGEDGRKD